MKRKKLVFLSLFLVCICSKAQEITGKVEDESGEPLSFANILLQAASDSTLIKGAISDETGDYLFENVSGGTYFVTASMVGFFHKIIRDF